MRFDPVMYVLAKKGCNSGGGGGGSSGGDNFPIGDGNTHIWISLAEGRTSPMLGVGVNGTVTVDWGDGSEPDTLTGTSAGTTKYTPVHNYEKEGDYVITLSTSGKISFTGDTSNGSRILKFSSTDSDMRNFAYRNSVRKVECGNGAELSRCALSHCTSMAAVKLPDDATSIPERAMNMCYSLQSVNIPNGVTSIDSYAFDSCRYLQNVNIPNEVTSIGRAAFQGCYSLQNVNIPDGVTSIGQDAFKNCVSLQDVSIPVGVTSIGTNVFQYCNGLEVLTIPKGAVSTGGGSFSYCYGLQQVNISDGVTDIGGSLFANCLSLVRVIFPESVASIGTGAFGNCSSAAIYDFSKHTAVPTLAATSAFSNIPADCQIRVPAALVDEWKAATNWSTYADKIVGV